jgi:DNA end-binding protein Ku
MWSGSITFGLVSIPVRLFTATREHRVRFHLLKKNDHSRIQRKYISSTDEKEESVQNDDLVRGYELSPNQFVIVSDEELEALQPKDSRTIEIAKFVDLDSIDPLFYDRPYYLAPGERAAKPYRLLLEAMKKTNKVGVAQFVMRKKEYLAALHALDDVICLYTMRFADEVIPADTIPGIGGEVHISDKESKMATELIESLADNFDPDEFHNQYRQHVEDLIKKKAEGEDIVTQAEPEERPHKVITLMAALQASLNEAKKSRRIGRASEQHDAPRRRKAG